MTTRHVALLRGINVGGKNKLAMKPLADLFAAEGCRDVATYLQSGNVVFSADPGEITTLAGRISARIAAEFSLKVPTVIRSAAELVAVVERNPLQSPDGSAATWHVMFLADLSAPERLATLDPARSPHDTCLVVGRDIYLDLPRGVAGSKFTNAYFDARLATVSTCRNWRTVLELRAMVQN